MIGDFTDGNINHHIILQKGVVFKRRMKLPDNEGRKYIDFTGYTYKDQPVSNTFAKLDYYTKDDYHDEEGFFDAKMLLSGIGTRLKADSKIKCNSIGNWKNGVLNGQGLRQFKKGSHYEDDMVLYI